MRIQIVGIGMGNASSMTMQAAQAIREADVLVGAQRMLESAQDALLTERAALRALRTMTGPAKKPVKYSQRLHAAKFSGSEKPCAPR